MSWMMRISLERVTIDHLMPSACFWEKPQDRTSIWINSDPACSIHDISVAIVQSS